jgi:hypothetical protein
MDPSQKIDGDDPMRLPRCIARLVLSATALAEYDAVDAFLRTHDALMFLRYLRASPPRFATQRGYETRYSASYRITRCFDIYGPEVDIDGIGWIDVHPSRYNITRNEADYILDAILGQSSLCQIDTDPNLYRVISGGQRVLDNV